MSLPTGANGGGLPQRPGGGLPQRPGGGLPNSPQRPTPAPQLPDFDGLPDVTPPRPAPQDPGFSGMERLQDYDFGGQQVDTSNLNRKPEDDEEPKSFDFPELDDEVAPELELDDEEESLQKEVTARKTRSAAERFDKAQREQPTRKRAKNNVLKAQSGELDENGQNLFVDKKGKKVEPFGGKKSSVRVSDLDRRKNMRQNARIVQAIVVIGVVVLVGFGAKNAIFPDKGLTPTDVQDIVYSTTGTSSFPLEQGRYFAETFMEAYLEYNPQDPTSSSVMQYFTRGALQAGGEALGTTVSDGFTQKVTYGPFTYSSSSVTANSANYVVGALVETSNKSPDAPEATSGTLSWKYFSVNVYYDSDQQAFGIANAPTVTPVPKLVNSTDVPADSPLGVGPAETSVAAEITPTVYGFLEAYRVSTPQDFSKLLPFVGSDPDPSILTGLDSAYAFSGGSANEESVVITPFATQTAMIKAMVTIKWTEEIDGATSEVSSNYVMDINPVSGGYTVSRFVPLAYAPQLE